MAEPMKASFMKQYLRAPIDIKNHHSSESSGAEPGVSLRSAVVVWAMAGMAHQRLTGIDDEKLPERLAREGRMER